VTATADAPVPVSFPELAITKTASPGVVADGDTLTYTVTVTNTGSSTQTGVTVTDPLPSGLSQVGPVTVSKPSFANAFDGFGPTRRGCRAPAGPPPSGPRSAKTRTQVVVGSKFGPTEGNPGRRSGSTWATTRPGQSPGRSIWPAPTPERSASIAAVRTTTAGAGSSTSVWRARP
jgi:uncharacterized repeat protein (TIGR01451 family)